MSLGPADGELFEEAVIAPRRAWLPLPDLRVIERPGWLQLITPSFRTGGFNGVSLSVLEDASADAVIDATIAEYRALGIRFRWVVGRDSAPRDLGDRLARRGLEAREVIAMARATAEPVQGEPAGGPIAVERIGPASEQAYTAVMAEGWGVEPAPLRVANALALDDPERNHLYLARVEGEPAGVAASIRFARSEYLLGAVVLPSFRRRGVYRALVAARLADAAAAGRAIATSQARASSSAPLLAHMGFREVDRLWFYEG